MAKLEEELVENQPVDVEGVPLKPANEKAMAKSPDAKKPGFADGLDGAVIAKDGDSYASLGETNAPKGVSGREFAKTLFSLNNGAPVRPGSIVKIK